MTKLKRLRSRLAGLSRRRWLLRLLSGYSGLLLAVLAVVVGVFLIDWLTEMGRLYRLLAHVGIAATVVWGFSHYVRPMLGLRETVLDMALFVEAQHKIDSDFVAAIEFETPEAESWGSRQLQGAVIEHVAGVAPGVNVFRGLDYRTVSRRATALAASVLVIAAAVGWFPGHAAAFFNRLLLGPAHYPTDTIIHRVTINGRVIDLSPGHNTKMLLPHGGEVVFNIECAGKLPKSGTISAWYLDGSLETELDLLPVNVTRLSRLSAISGAAIFGAADILKPMPRDPDSTAPSGRADGDHKFALSLKGFSPDDAPNGGAAHDATPQGPTRRYTARITKLTNSIGFQIVIGDAWTDPAVIEVIPLPQIDVTLRVTPPAYTSAGEQLEIPAGSRQIAVIEGSRVDVVLTTNKPLESAVLTIKKQRYDLAPTSVDSVHPSGNGLANPEGETWTIGGASPLDKVEEPLHFQIEVVDVDGLTLEKPIEGYIRLRTDGVPKVFADIHTRHVLPSAVANVFYGASDDYGVAELSVNVRVLRTGDDRGKGVKEPPATKLPIPLTKNPRKVSSLLFQLEPSLAAALSQKDIGRIRREFADRRVTLSPQAAIPFARRGGGRWLISDQIANASGSAKGGNGANGEGTPLRHFEIREQNQALNVYRVYPLKLSEFDLRVGDQVRIELQAVDYRGAAPGKSSASEAIFLTVTDETGFLAASAETDQRSADQLDAIIRLGLGDSP